MDFEQYNFNTIMNNALSRVPNNVDKSEGSIIYDALAPCCYALANYYLDLKEISDSQFLSTSYGSYLDELAEQFGITRKQATKAIKKGEFYDEDNNLVDITVGDRFSTPTGENSLTYTAIEKISTGKYKLECDTAGTAGNAYTGLIIPVSYLNDVSISQLTDTLELGTDEETDEQLKNRCIETINKKPFGGNTADYVRITKEQPGVGSVQVYPVWNGGGTVKLSVLDTEYNLLSSSAIEVLQEIIDPTQDGSGYGLAPIGHVVTVATGTILTLNITANIESDIEITDLQSDIENAINRYIEDIVTKWDNLENYGYVQTIYISRIASAILTVGGINNVEDVEINGYTNDVTLEESVSVQQVPALGTVTIGRIE